MSADLQRTFRRRRLLLALAGGLAVLTSVVLALTRTSGMRHVDGWFTDVVSDHLGPRAMPAAAAVTDLGNPDQALVLVLAVVAAAALIVPPARLAVVALILVGANGTGVLASACCERVVEVPLPGGITLPTQASAPSNHTVLAVSVGVAAVLVVPWAMLTVAFACALVFAGAMAVSVLVQRTHVLSDVVSGALLVSSWLALALAAEPLFRSRLPDHLGPFPLHRARVPVLSLTCAAVVWVLLPRTSGQVGTVGDIVAEHPAAALLVVGVAVAAGATVQLLARRLSAPPHQPPRSRSRRATSSSTSSGALP